MIRRMLFVAAATACVPVDAADWPRLRGPDGLGYAEGPEVPTRFGEDQNLLWKTALPGAGSSSPVVSGDRVFVTCYTGEGGGAGLTRQVLAIELATGRVMWRRDVAAEQPDDPYQGFLTQHGYASNTPATDGERLYVMFGKGGVLAYDLDGNRLWRVDVGQQSNEREWGSAASLSLHRDMVIVNSSEESQSIRALDTATGKQRWKVESDRLKLCYNTPTLGQAADGRVELIVPTPGEVWSLNPNTGEFRWRAAIPLDRNVSPSAVVAGGVAYLYGGRPGWAVAVRLGGAGDVTDTHVLWTARDSSYVATPLLHRGLLFWASDRGMAFCVDAASGETLTRRRLKTRTSGRPFYASGVLSGERIIVPSRYDGIFVFSAERDFETLAVNRFDRDDSQFNATPAIVDGKLLIRSDKFLYCVARTPPVDAAAAN